MRRAAYLGACWCLSGCGDPGGESTGRRLASQVAWSETLEACPDNFCDRSVPDLRCDEGTTVCAELDGTAWRCDCDSTCHPDEPGACGAAAFLPPEETAAPGLPDSDGDGWPDDVDACPTAWGEQEGCPGRADADGDGTPDEADWCPGEWGDEQNGCPVEQWCTCWDEDGWEYEVPCEESC